MTQTSRIRASLPAEFRASRRQGRGHVRNLGPAGLFLNTKASLDQGDLVDLRFRMPRGEPVSLRALVWWTTRESGGRCPWPGCGLRLLEDNDDYTRALAPLLR